MQFKRGEVLYHRKFIYPATGLECDKLLLVVNKSHSDPDDVVIIPCTTRRKEDLIPYKAWCDTAFQVFYFEKKIGFYNEGTLLQLHFIQTLSVEYLRQRIAGGEIERLKNGTTENEFNQIINCLRKIKDDIPMEVQELIF